MEERTQPNLREIHPHIPAPLSNEEQKSADDTGRDTRQSLDKPPKDLPKRVQGNKKIVNQKLREYRAQLDAVLKERERSYRETGMGDGHIPVIHTLEDRIKFKVPISDLSSWEEQERFLRKPLRTMAPLLKRFDWREFGVVPRLRIQEGGTCWAYVATQAFECSLMMQRANFFMVPEQAGDSIFPEEQVTVNVNITLDKFDPNRSSSGGNYEQAFNHYITDGIPVREIRIDDFDNRDSEIPVQQGKRPKKLKAVAWDWVFAKCWRTPKPEGDAILKVKEALLEHGPLAVRVSIREFEKYGKPRQDGEITDDGAVARAGMSLRFPPNTATFERQKNGKLLLELPLGVIDNMSDAVVLRFPQDQAPIVELQTKKNIKPRPTDCDDEVSYDPRLTQREAITFTANNAVEIETSETGEVIVQFPPNTDARFRWDLATRDLIVRFPKDNAPTFKSNSGVRANHVVLLIGWDDDRCAWIIQNTFSDWGYQCGRPQNVYHKESGELVPAYENRGYMYIMWGCNFIGERAAWVQAPLLKRGMWMNMRKKKNKAS